MFILKLLVILVGLFLVGVGLIGLAAMLPFLWFIYALLVGAGLLLKMGVISID